MRLFSLNLILKLLTNIPKPYVGLASFFSDTFIATEDSDAVPSNVEEEHRDQKNHVHAYPKSSIEHRVSLFTKDYSLTTNNYV